MLDLILRVIFENFLYFTGRLLLPVLSFGHWRVMPLKAEIVLWQGPSFQPETPNRCAQQPGDQASTR